MRSAAQHEEMVATAMIKNQKDFAAGLFYIVIGLFGATTLGENEIGSLSRMGPGYFPLIISTGIIPPDWPSRLNRFSLRRRCPQKAELSSADRSQACSFSEVLRSMPQPS